jgi:hypothetical protein
LAWQWGWVCEEKGSLPSATIEAVKTVRDHGAKYEIPELVYAELALGTEDDRPWFNADYLAMISVHISHADFYVTGPVKGAPELVMYWLVQAPQVPSPPQSDARTMASAISQATAAWGSAFLGSSGREMIRAYAERKGCRLSEVGKQTLQIDTPSQRTLTIELDELDAIAGLELPAASPEPKRTSWLNRLFGGGHG